MFGWDEEFRRLHSWRFQLFQFDFVDDPELGEGEDEDTSRDWEREWDGEWEWKDEIGKCQYEYES